MEYKIITKNQNANRAICLGYFDGIHLGHQKLVEKMIKEAKEYQLTPTFLTFDPNPNYVLKFSKEDEIISSIEERIEICKKMGVEDFIILNFNEEVMNSTKEEFISFLLNELNVKNITVGFDFSFGVRGSGKVSDLLNIGNGIKVNVIDKFTFEDKKISSSTIIEDIKNGNVKDLIHTLGRYYTLKGEVSKGLRNGHKLGFPTINIKILDKLVKPLSGVYAVRVKIDETYYRGMANVGVHPSIAKLDERILEVHIFDFAENVYGKVVSVEFLDFIRKEQKFNSLDELIEQLNIDKRKIETEWRW